MKNSLKFFLVILSSSLLFACSDKVSNEQISLSKENASTEFFDNMFDGLFYYASAVYAYGVEEKVFFRKIDLDYALAALKNGAPENICLDDRNSLYCSRVESSENSENSDVDHILNRKDAPVLVNSKNRYSSKIPIKIAKLLKTKINERASNSKDYTFFIEFSDTKYVIHFKNIDTENYSEFSIPALSLKDVK